MGIFRVRVIFRVRDIFIREEREKGRGVHSQGGDTFKEEGGSHT